MQRFGQTIGAIPVSNDDIRVRSSGDLRQEEKQFLAANGFLAVPDYSTQSELEELRTLISSVLDDHALAQKTTVRDLAGPSAHEKALSIREVVSPSKLEPRLLETRIYQRAVTITESLYGPGATLAFDHIIDKPANNMKETAWHQDSAYSSLLSMSARRLHWWVPLQDVDENNGCMAYVPGSHVGPRYPHEPVAAGSHTRKVTDTSFADQAHYCAVPAGAACMHLPRTLHYTGPNRTEKPRIAWIFQIVVRSKMARWV